MTPRDAQVADDRQHPSGGVAALIDACAVAIAVWFAYQIRFDFDVRQVYETQMWFILPYVIILRTAGVYLARGYTAQHGGVPTPNRRSLIQGVLIGSGILVLTGYMRSYAVGGLGVSAILVALIAVRAARSGESMSAVTRPIILMLLILAISLSIHVAGQQEMPSPLVAGLSAWTHPVDVRLDPSLPRSVVVLEAILSLVLLQGWRDAARLRSGRWSDRDRKRVLVYGAGAEGERVARKIGESAEFGHEVIGFVDDNPARLGSVVLGRPVLGAGADLDWLLDAHGPDELIVATFSLTEDDLRSVARSCRERRVPMRQVPGISSAPGEDTLVPGVAGDVADLIGRAEIELDPQAVIDYLEGRVVMVTGAGGSIGSELCRQISRCRPARLLMVGRGENPLYEAMQKLRGPGAPEIVGLVGDVANRSKMASILLEYGPSVVFHAAAHKHVPFMEEFPEEAVLNNILGTRCIAELAAVHSVEKFVMISSDKAVSPSSVMGASKKIAEMVLQQLSLEGTTTEFTTVRFGNVLRSRGSVGLLFEKQIQEGGPVTVTHPGMTRFFMTIPEAVRLVLHSAVVSSGGDLCVLDMGEPVRIVDLARNMIRLAGRDPEEIEIVFTGIREGEKLHEALFTEAEAKLVKRVDRILVCQPRHTQLDLLAQWLPELERVALACDRDNTRRLLAKIVPSLAESRRVATTDREGDLS